MSLQKNIIKPGIASMKQKLLATFLFSFFILSKDSEENPSPTYKISLKCFKELFDDFHIIIFASQR